MSLGLVEILVVLAVFVILGPRRITSLLRALGRGTHDFFDALGRGGGKSELSDEGEDTPEEPRRGPH